MSGIISVSFQRKLTDNLLRNRFFFNVKWRSSFSGYRITHFKPRLSIIYLTYNSMAHVLNIWKYGLLIWEKRFKEFWDLRKLLSIVQKLIFHIRFFFEACLSLFCHFGMVFLPFHIPNVFFFFLFFLLVYLFQLLSSLNIWLFRKHKCNKIRYFVYAMARTQDTKMQKPLNIGTKITYITEACKF